MDVHLKKLLSNLFPSLKHRPLTYSLWVCFLLMQSPGECFVLERSNTKCDRESNSASYCLFPVITYFQRRIDVEWKICYYNSSTRSCPLQTQFNLMITAFEGTPAIFMTNNIQYPPNAIPGSLGIVEISGILLGSVLTVCVVLLPCLSTNTVVWRFARRNDRRSGRLHRAVAMRWNRRSAGCCSDISVIGSHNSGVHMAWGWGEGDAWVWSPVSDDGGDNIIYR